MLLAHTQLNDSDACAHAQATRANWDIKTANLQLLQINLMALTIERDERFNAEE